MNFSIDESDIELLGILDLLANILIEIEDDFSDRLNQLDISSLIGGIYFLRMKQSDLWTSKKVIKL